MQKVQAVSTRESINKNQRPKVLIRRRGAVLTIIPDLSVRRREQFLKAAIELDE